MSRAGLPVVIICLLLLPTTATTSGTAQSPASSNCLLEPQVHPPGADKTVALIAPVYTATPYSGYPSSSFYYFFLIHDNATGNVTTGLDQLSTNVSYGQGFRGGWGNDHSILDFFNSPQAVQCGFHVGGNVKVLTDPQVDAGGLFAGGRRLFDSAVIGHEEYVTRNEYSQLKQFVADGGRLVVLDADSLNALVKYDGKTVTYVTGHGWTFNGISAWKSTTRPFLANNTDWFGGVYCCFNRLTDHQVVVNQSNPVGYALFQQYGQRTFSLNVSREQDQITNTTGTSIIAKFVDVPGALIAAYVHHYRQGYVISYSGLGSDAILIDQSVEYFIVLAIGADLVSLGPTGQYQVSSPSDELPLVASVAFVGSVFIYSWWSRGRSRRLFGPRHVISTSISTLISRIGGFQSGTREPVYATPTSSNRGNPP